MIRQVAVAVVNVAARLADKAICAWPNNTHTPINEEDQ